MIKIEQLRTKIIEPVIEEYEDLIPGLNEFDKDYCKDLCSSLLLGTSLAETYGGYYIYDKELSRNGIYGMTYDMLNQCVNDEEYQGVQKDFVKNAFDNLITDLNFSTQMAFMFYLKSGALNWLIEETGAETTHVSKITKAWVDYYRNGKANPAKFYALYCKVVLNKYKNQSEKDSRCTRCGFEDRKTLSLGRRVEPYKENFNDTQPINNKGRDFNDEKYFR